MNQNLSLRAEIPFSKNKSALLMLAAIAFIAIGCWLIITPPQSGNDFFSNPVLLRVIGIIAVAFFGTAAYFIARNLTAKGPGLIIDNAGISDLSGAASAKKIFWKDIEAIEVLTIKSQRLIMFKVSNPQDYINGQSNRFKRKMLELNYKWYGAPVGISANGFKISFEELLQLVSDRFEAIKIK
ncbi:MAG: hypothetical protein J0H29_06575 [Sphingobacteriales bacterium]|nr:hypothetical protein [Sphingobacteriales bacterium]OJY90119.1 MAG: hypothetical protein BGP14_10465 [Sphingobacteriales bacterium 44-15]